MSIKRRSSKAEKHTPQPNPLALEGRRADHPSVAYAKSQLPLPLAPGLGGGLTILLLAQLSKSICTVLLIAPFGANYVLLFAIPQSPLAQPNNVIGEHFLSAVTGLLVCMLAGRGALVWEAHAVLQFTDALHPRAGKDPLVTSLAHARQAFLCTLTHGCTRPCCHGMVSITAAIPAGPTLSRAASNPSRFVLPAF